MRRFIPILAGLLLAAGPAHAEFLIEPIDVPDHDCFAPAVAVSPDGVAMVAFTAEGVTAQSLIMAQVMPTHPRDGEALPPPVTVGPGSGAHLCWSRDGFTLAVADGSVIQLWQADHQGTWLTDSPTLIQADAEVIGLDLWGAPTDAAGHAVFLTFTTAEDPWLWGGRVFFASRSSYYGWSSPELLVEADGQYPHSQVTWSLGPAGPVPTVYYLDGEPGSTLLMFTTRQVETGWTTPQAVPGDGAANPSPIGGEFAVVHPYDLERHVLGVGLQPTCPCNTLYHQAYHPPAGWQPAEVVSQEYDYYDWPMSPNLAVGLDGPVHAFWFQEASNMYLEPHLQTLEYWTRVEGVWQHAGDFLAAENGAGLGWRVALDVSFDGWPVLAWSRTDTIEGLPRPEQVFVARPRAPSPVPQDTPAVTALGLDAWPNPFNPRVQLEFELPRSAVVRLEIFDTRGRRVARLVDGFRPGGGNRVAWDGTDRAGRALPGGVYFARLTGRQAGAVVKLVLAR